MRHARRIRLGFVGVIAFIAVALTGCVSEADIERVRQQIEGCVADGGFPQYRWDEHHAEYQFFGCVQTDVPPPTIHP